MPSVLIVDDSVVARSTLAKALERVPGLTVLRPAPNGEAAMQRFVNGRPDVVVLDVDMPGMGGLATLDLIRAQAPETRVIVFSALTAAGAVVTLDALARGAADVMAKPSVGFGDAALRELVAKIRGLAVPARQSGPVTKRRMASTNGPVDAVVIGVSTGGPNALIELIPQLPGDLPVPVLIVQHMPPNFTALLAERLDARSALCVREATDGALAGPGQVWIAPGDQHLAVRGEGDCHLLELDDGPPENSCRPAVDVLFRSAASRYGRRLLGVVMTGMGQDGLHGGEAIVAAGGRLLVQDEASSVVWGMPGAIVRAGIADGVLPLGELAAEIRRRVCRGATRTPEAQP